MMVNERVGKKKTFLIAMTSGQIKATSRTDLLPPSSVASWFREMGPRLFHGNLGEGAI